MNSELVLSSHLPFTFHSSLFTVHSFISALSFAAVWTGGRVAEGVGLENRYTRKGIVGSNPTLSVVATLINLASQ